MSRKPNAAKAAAPVASLAAIAPLDSASESERESEHESERESEHESERESLASLSAAKADAKADAKAASTSNATKKATQPAQSAGKADAKAAPSAAKVNAKVNAKADAKAAQSAAKASQPAADSDASDSDASESAAPAGDETYEQIVADLIRCQATAKQLRALISEERNEVDDLRDMISVHLELIVRQHVARRLGRHVHEVAIDWDAPSDAKPMSERDGRVYLSGDLARSIVVECDVGALPMLADQMSQGSSAKPTKMYLKLDGGVERRTRLNETSFNRFLRACKDDKGADPAQTDKVKRSFEGLADFCLAHIDDAAAFFADDEIAASDDE